MTFTRYLGNNAGGFGSASIAGIQAGQNIAGTQQQSILQALAVEQALTAQLNERLATEQFGINRAAGQDPLTAQANLFAQAPNQAIGDRALLGFATNAATLAPFAQAAQAAGGQGAFNNFNSALAGLGLGNPNFNGQSALVTNGLLGQSLLGPELFQSQQNLARSLLGDRASQPGFPPNGFFNNPLGYQDRFGTRDGNSAFDSIRALNGASQTNTTRRFL